MPIHPWYCVECGATEDFTATIDRMVHATRGHIGRVVALDSDDIPHSVQKNPNTGAWS